MHKYRTIELFHRQKNPRNLFRGIHFPENTYFDAVMLTCRQFAVKVQTFWPFQESRNKDYAKNIYFQN